MSNIPNPKDSLEFELINRWVMSPDNIALLDKHAINVWTRDAFLARTWKGFCVWYGQIYTVIPHQRYPQTDLPFVAISFRKPKSYDTGFALYKYIPQQSLGSSYTLDLEITS